MLRTWPAFPWQVRSVLTNSVMIITGLNLIHYLLHKGLVDVASCVAGDFSAVDQSSRNVNFLVDRKTGPGYAIKQAKTWKPDQIETLRVEATFYWLVNHEAAFQVLKPFLPGFVTYDFIHHILVIEKVAGAGDLFNYYWEGTETAPWVGERAAEILWLLHSIPFSEIPSDIAASNFKGSLPWVFNLFQRPPGEWDQAFPDTAGQQTMQLITRFPEFFERIRTAAREWERSTLIHGDLRFNNFLLQRASADSGSAGLKLIDWELADHGDPVWDVAAFIQHYLSLWLMREENSGEPGSLENMKTSVAAFWNTYAGLNAWDAPKRRSQWLKIIRFCALRLINSCFEVTPHVKNIQPYSAKILQLSFNLLLQPTEAGKTLFGLEY